MNRLNAVENFKKYLNSNNIKYTVDLDCGTFRINLLYDGYNNCPDKRLESCIWFHEDCIEARVYYSQLGSECCKTSSHLGELMYLFNYINAYIWPQIADESGNTHYLHTSRLYMTEDGANDITLTTMINYDFFEISMLKTLEYITAGCPELLDKLSLAIFALLFGSMSLEESKSYINNFIIEKKNNWDLKHLYP